jgi:hypothetical protein
MEVHPAIVKKMDELFRRAEELITAHQRNVKLLARAVETRDLYAMKVRVAEIVSLSPKLYWIAAQIEALKNITHEIEMNEMGQRLLGNRDAE